MADPDPVAPRPVVQNFQPARRQVGDGPDTDLDGLSDDFETNVFGSDPKQPDKDGDGLSDWAEYWVDTNPNDADTDGDKWTDGEDLVFGDPLRQNAGGAERAKSLADARRQFDAEGSDRDKDFARDHLEKEFGTKSDNPDSDNDGLGDMIELQLKTNPMRPAGDTGDLDAARQHLGERRWAAEEAARDSSGSSLEPDQSTDSFAVEEASSEPPGFTDTVSAGAAYEAPVYQEPFVNDATGDVCSQIAATVPHCRIMDSDTTTPAFARRARCHDPRGSLTGLFFSDNPNDILRAKAICSRCTITELCLAAAIHRKEPCGVWGGEQLFDGQVVVNRRGRGRPRKVALPSPLDIDEISGQPIVA